MGYFIESQGKSYFRHIPLRLLQQYLGFFGNSAMDDFYSASAGGLFQHFIQVVDMYVQCFGKFYGGFELYHLCYRFQSETAFPIIL
jgi:hypothetical protein